MFRADLISCEQTSWEDLFAGFTTLKAITFSSSIEMLLRLAERLDDMEVVFGSESILSKEHLALAQASQTIAGLWLRRCAGRSEGAGRGACRGCWAAAAARLLERVVAGSLRFRLLRGRPSHEKLYLLSGPAGSRVLTGSANLSRAAFEGRQHEIYVAFDGEPAWQLFDGYYQRDWKDSVPVEPDALVTVERRTAPVARDDAAGARGGADRAGAERPASPWSIQPPRPAPAGFAAEALRRRPRSAPN